MFDVMASLTRLTLVMASLTLVMASLTLAILCTVLRYCTQVLYSTLEISQTHNNHMQLIWEIRNWDSTRSHLVTFCEKPDSKCCRRKKVVVLTLQ